MNHKPRAIRVLGTAGVGICRTGTQTCTSGTWSACAGEVKPATEVCGNDVDEDCDGLVDCADPDCSQAANCTGTKYGVPIETICNDNLDNDGATLETTDRKEGAGCANLRAGDKDSLSIYDDSLSTNFPTRSSDPNVVMTVCFWMKPRSFPLNATVISKYQIATDTRSWRLYLGSLPAYHLKLGLGKGTGDEFTDYAFNQPTELLVANHWYHVAFTYKGSNRYYHVRVWDGTDNVLRVDREGTAVAPMAVTNAPLILGNTPLESSYFDGLLDEVAVFHEVLTSSQMDKVRRGECRLY